MWLYRGALIAAILWLMGVIFAFSAQVGAETNALTETAVLPVAELLASLQEGTEATVETLYVIIGGVVRKIAHLAEYALLAGLIWLLLDSFGRRGWLLPALIAICYAATDEVHQAFVPGRLGTPVDVVIDAVGAFCGAWIISRISDHIRRKKNVHHP